MRKLLLAVFSVAVLSTCSFAGGWGVGVKLGVGQNDPKGMEEDFNYYGGTFTKAPGIFAIEGLYEWDLEGERLDIVGSSNKLGLRFGLEGYGENKLEVGGSSEKENTGALPITVYYKKDGGIQSVSYYVGGGLTYIDTTISITGAGDIDEGKWFPHVILGTEYRFTKLFALGVDLKYNIAAKVKRDGSILSDRSGLQGVLAARFYF